MTPEQLREAAAVMLAASEGKAIECRGRSGQWIAVDPLRCGFAWSILDYRIKPELRKVKVCLFRSPHGEIEPFRVDAAVGRACMAVSDIVEIEIKDE